MSISDLEKQLDQIMEKRDKLEEKCDTLPQCQEDDGCETCKIFRQISELDEKIESIENKIEELMAAEEEEE